MSRFARRIQTTAPTPPAPPSGNLLGWELTTSNTGLAQYGINGATLPTYTGSQTPAAGTTISMMKITQPLDLSNGNITLDRCYIQPTSVGQGLPVITTIGWEQDKKPAIIPNVIDCTFTGTALASDQARGQTIALYGIANVSGCQISSFGSGFATISGNLQSSVVIEHNYVHTLISYGDGATTGNHCDGYTIRGFSAASNPSRTIQMRYNRFDCSTNNASGAFFIQPIADRIDNAHLEGNYLEGDAYNLVLGTHNFTYSNMSCNNTRFRPTGYGPGYVADGEGWTPFTEGYRYHATNTDHRGAVVTM